MSAHRFAHCWHIQGHRERLGPPRLEFVFSGTDEPSRGKPFLVPCQGGCGPSALGSMLLTKTTSVNRIPGFYRPTTAMSRLFNRCSAPVRPKNLDAWAIHCFHLLNRLCNTVGSHVDVAHHPFDSDFHFIFHCDSRKDSSLNSHLTHNRHNFATVKRTMPQESQGARF